MVSLKITKLICKRQGVNFKPEQMLICPRCSRRTARMNILKGEWDCIRCGKEGTEEELLRLVNEEFGYKHSKIKSTMSEKKGVQQ